MPAPSPSSRSVITVGKPSRSAQRKYMRRSISAQSWLSVPPAPGWMVTIALRASFSPESSMAVSMRSRNSAYCFMSRSISPVTSSPSRASSKRVSRSSVRLWMRPSLAMDCSRRLRSCITFWPFSGFDQKSADPIRCSMAVSFSFCAATSKIPPHGQGLFAEGHVFAVQLFYCHGLSVQF